MASLAAYKTSLETAMDNYENSRDQVTLVSSIKSLLDTMVTSASYDEPGEEDASRQRFADDLGAAIEAFIQSGDRGAWADEVGAATDTFVKSGTVNTVTAGTAALITPGLSSAATTGTGTGVWS